MFGTAIPRFDPGAEGIHLIWTWPDILPLSEAGYDIQRRPRLLHFGSKQCETIDRPIIDLLEAHGEYLAPLGPLRLCRRVRFVPTLDSTLLPNDQDISQLQQSSNGSTALLNVPTSSTHMSDNLLDKFIQELSMPADHVEVTAQAGGVFAIALRGGKAVAFASATTIPLTMQLAASGIDTVIVYGSSVESLTICALEPLDPQIEEQEWAAVPYLVQGLTLPVMEADPTLTSADAEYDVASSRLVGSEQLARDDFERMTASLRLAAAGTGGGRSGERVVLVRSTSNQPYEEMSFEAQLSLLTIHPKIRRVLGFGFADHQGLVAGVAYEYRITGRFHAEDLYDKIYDVHLAPSSTLLPASFTIRDLSLRFQRPVKTLCDPAPPSSDLTAVSRRGIFIETTAFDRSWTSPDFGGWSAIIDFPSPVTSVVLEVALGHSFKYAGGDYVTPFSTVPPAPVPDVPEAILNFASPIAQLRLSGTGTFYALRIPSGGTGLTEIHAYAIATYSPLPLPEPPPLLNVYNLQEPPTVLNGPIDESTSIPTRPQCGFRLNWLPAAKDGISYWPEDLDAGPPLDAIAYLIQHHIEPSEPHILWDAIVENDNLTIGSRDTTQPDVRVEDGMDFDQVFPRQRPRSSETRFAIHTSDVFGQTDPTTGTVRPDQPLGSSHRYRIRAMDAVGRLSATWTDSNVVRLEKHLPPPLPVGPQLKDAQGHLITPSMPTARAIVAGAPGLTPEDITLLGTHDNVIVLRWGWRQNERELDPTTQEFRVYISAPQDVVRGTITNVISSSPNWQLSLTTNFALIEDECAGQWIQCGGYPFHIISNSAGMSPIMLVEPALAKPSAVPTVGTVTFGRPLRAEHQRPSEWSQRVAAYPLTSDDSYQHVFYNALTVDAAHPRDAIWVGVSAADGQTYVDDELTTGINVPRPGNESSIVTCSVTARYHGQPTFDVPPAIADVPELLTEEPTGRQILVALDLVTMLNGTLIPGAPIALERCSSDDIISRVSVQGSDVVLTYPDGSHQTVTFANPADHNDVVSTLNSSDPQRLANRYLAYLVINAAQPEAFFQRVSGQIDTVSMLNDRLTPKPGRFFYRVRLADPMGHISQEGMILPLVVRVPSTAAAVRPLRKAMTAASTGVTLTLSIPADPDTTDVLLFTTVVPQGATPTIQGDAELLRVPNRPDLYPQDGLRLRLSDGTLLTPVVKSLSDSDVSLDPDCLPDTDCSRIVSLVTNAPVGSWVFMWSYGLTHDGFASFVCGPFSCGVNS